MEVRGSRLISRCLWLCTSISFFSRLMNLCRLERGRRSRSPSPVPPSPSILRKREPLPSIHGSSTPAIQIPPQGRYASNPIYMNPHTHISPPSSPIVAQSPSTSPAIPSILHTQLSGMPPVPQLPASTLPDRLSASDDDLIENDLLKKMLARLSSEPPLLVSLRGTFFKLTLSWLLAGLPPSTRLHLDVTGIIREDGNDRYDYVMNTEDEEDEDFDYDLCTALPVQCSNLEAIHCGRHTISLWWISANAPGEDIYPLKIYLP
ncbi:hypothetical protein BKA70DRAFT_1471220 [Coprinopsis sp. MPI-PUGE-AT-0042]|nr:hypothetical protein BKA70DRAFT_1471220 [Coprinopsis sp. MPI-PUGE-AT-0042]